MAWTKKGTRLALAGYLLVAVAVLGGLAWATILALRLEEADLTARREKDRSRDLRLAVRRLDARVQSTISRETSRGPHEYYAVVSRETILYGDRRPAVKLFYAYAPRPLQFFTRRHCTKRLTYGR